MMNPGNLVTDRKGRRYLVEREIAAGGQGIAFAVRDEATGRLLVAKVSHPHMATPAAAERLDALVHLDLSARSHALCGPSLRLHDQHGVGAVLPLAEGESLETLFGSAPPTLLEALTIGAVLCRALVILETVGVAHGDIAASNVMVETGLTLPHPRVFLLDFDNAQIPGTPPPALSGQQLYAAPEVLVGGPPSLEGDRYATAILLHELLLGRHPYTGVLTAGMKTAAHAKFMRAATWPEDPATGTSSALATGLPPVGILPRAVHDHFRRALQPDPTLRPSAAAWGQALEDALANIYECPCGRRFVNDPTTFACPYPDCRKAAIPFVFLVNGRTLKLTNFATRIGRDEVGADARVSREHLVLSRRGFALRVECRSTNGLAVGGRTGWHLLQKNEVLDVGLGDRLRLAPGIEGVIQASKA